MRFPVQPPAPRSSSCNKTMLVVYQFDRVLVTYHAFSATSLETHVTLFPLSRKDIMRFPYCPRVPLFCLMQTHAQDRRTIKTMESPYLSLLSQMQVFDFLLKIHLGVEKS